MARVGYIRTQPRGTVVCTSRCAHQPCRTAITTTHTRQLGGGSTPSLACDSRDASCCHLTLQSDALSGPVLGRYRQYPGGPTAASQASLQGVPGVSSCPDRGRPTRPRAG